MKSKNNKLYNLKNQSRKAIFKQDDFMIGTCCIKNTKIQQINKYNSSKRFINKKENKLI